MLEPQVNSLPERKVRPGKVGLVIIIGALSAFGPFSIDMYLPGLPSLSSDLGGPAWQVQLTLTACLVGLAFGQIIAGPISDVMGRRRPLLAGLFLYALASILCAFAPNTPILILLRLLQGAAGSTGIVLSRAIVRDLYSGNEIARFFALTSMISGVAPILAPVVGGQLLNFTSWRGVFVVLMAFGAILLAAVFFFLDESLPEENRRGGGLGKTLSAFKLLLSDRHFVGYTFSAGLAFAAMFCYISGSPFVVEDIYHVSPQLFSLIFAVNALGIVACSQISGRLVGRVAPRTLMRIGLAVSMTGCLLLVVAVATNVGLVGILPCFFLVVASMGLTMPNSVALALSDHPEVAGSASGLMGVLQYLVGGIVSPLVGVAGTSTVWPLAIVMAVVSTAGFLVFTLLTATRSESGLNRIAS